MYDNDDADKPRTRYPLPINKLYGVPQRTYSLLKTKRISNCSQLLGAVGPFEQRDQLSRSSGIDLSELTVLVQRADMSRINGIGAVFGMMLEDLGICDVQSLAGQEADALHRKLCIHNKQEQLSRRSPTPEEVADWVEQSKKLTPLVTYEAPNKSRA